ncbi:hypothetical protein HYR69_02835 [Candidatus Sumerlaeota bacterium]|nr:hypothetical protein [Candidatus Sumerlaeota bacterium]
MTPKSRCVMIHAAGGEFTFFKPILAGKVELMPTVVKLWTCARESLAAWLRHKAARRGCVLGSLALALTLRGDAEKPSSPAPRGSEVPRPAVEGPVTGGKGRTTFDLATVGYTESEYFFSGTARSYVNAGSFGADGKWSVTPGETAAYKTRMLVIRPIEAGKFNGSVVVEWLNVSGGIDAAADWIMMHTELIRDGFAWVGVSAQFVGVEGGPALMGVRSIPLNHRRVAVGVPFGHVCERNPSGRQYL